MLMHTSSHCMFDQKPVAALEILKTAKVVDHRIENGTRRIDLVSDELAQHIPYAVEIGTGGGCTTHYEELIPLLVRAVQELAEAQTATATVTPKKPSTRKAKDKQDVQA